MHAGVAIAYYILEGRGALQQQGSPVFYVLFPGRRNSVQTFGRTNPVNTPLLADF